MIKFTLSQDEISSLKKAHKESRNKRYAYRINTIMQLGTGRTIRGVAEAPLLDDGIIRNYLKCFKAGGIKALFNHNYTGYGGRLSKSMVV